MKRGIGALPRNLCSCATGCVASCHGACIGLPEETLICFWWARAWSIEKPVIRFIFFSHCILGLPSFFVFFILFRRKKHSDFIFEIREASLAIGCTGRVVEAFLVQGVAVQLAGQVRLL